MTIQHPGQCNNFLCSVFHRLQFVVSGCCGLVFFLHGSSSRLQHYKKLMRKNRGKWRGGWRGTDYYMFILHISINLSLRSFCISDWITHVVLCVNGAMWSLVFSMNAVTHKFECEVMQRRHQKHKKSCTCLKQKPKLWCKNGWTQRNRAMLWLRV